MIALWVAPRAFLKPISLVLSVTDTSIIFITPMPPTTRLIPAIAAISNVNIPVACLLKSENWL